MSEYHRKTHKLEYHTSLLASRKRFFVSACVFVSALFRLPDCASGSNILMLSPDPDARVSKACVPDVSNGLYAMISELVLHLT